MTGASGTPYGIRALEALAKVPDLRVHLILTPTAERLLRFEARTEPDRVRALAHEVHANDDFFAPVASGSNRFLGMLVCPASMKHVGLMAAGIGMDLVSRTADVCLKERRPLVLVPRETPYSAIHLENMLRLTRAGAVIMPASPGFYHRPTRIEELVDFIVARVLDHLGVPHSLGARWGDDRDPAGDG